MMGRRILYAEDDADIRMMVVGELRHSGYLVEEAGDGEAAIRMLEAGAYDLVLLDIKMPGKSGLDVLTFMKEKGMKPRIIMLTGAGELSIAINTMKLGANDYITKPFGFEELLAAVKKWLT